MLERSGIITFKGNPLTLVGNEIQPGKALPDFKVVNNDLSEFSSSAIKGKVTVISVVPSLDTPVCDSQTRKFNEEASALGEDVQVYTVSMDLPFAQARWCGAAGIDRVTTLSDYREASFGEATGLLIKELKLLTRAVLVIDREGVVQYSQVVSEVTDEPDYDAVISAVKELI